jgi:hypothetical protein
LHPQQFFFAVKPILATTSRDYRAGWCFVRASHHFNSVVPES